MHISYILPFVAFGLGITNAAAIDDTNMLDTRAPHCPLGIELIRLQIKPGKSFTGVGKPGECKRIPKNIKDFNLDSDGTKSLLPCFVCTVFEHSDCSGSSETIEGHKEKFMAKGKKKQHWQSWKCVCKK
ncbi:hypothetical protein FOXG_22444 [Fusarium oxysporum f. sp. lycopersici 4287]|uniref:Uncharacterized protein n=2 Tax=Fusarium oxysporum TaxID=5507 RepID=A0A0J9V1P3_FUSO4|nr:hypothetical protein FOXG_19263 [Fusarium oxysporum f. sp. lycopersici 4287]XP_018242806.1 hypothetical protein FOXG_19395 [Fusarium oxysporum f. sp. lycopersici 4287]XP_018244730.1 hypothetical protein FOXG_19757 [Fusarium oxysporum f. sp. lycopersici 4287]XP_018257031.1 uncharacterized protein FOXG_22444 [Fusarium oxysporum f. sp. lycopersici 4287]EXK23467.1 hypothetical protein FOMG_19754 [Fusarium oxysporum f. sp. melonis 26406]KAJ9419179.1 hypothetical protein QL093DRAFT_2355585 [Fusar